jgi:hypothetical protein
MNTDAIRQMFLEKKNMPTPGSLTNITTVTHTNLTSIEKC